MENSVKSRCFPEHNYKAVWFNGKTIRFTYDNTKPITELEYPEFYDIKLTSKCNSNVGNLEMGPGCKYCYQNSSHCGKHAENLVENFKLFVSKMDENQKPFQWAAGGGEPTMHPEFNEWMKTCYELGMCPNYTTNGVNISEETYKTTKQYAGGVAVSCHPHLDSYWRAAVKRFTEMDILTNLHIIISDRNSVDTFVEIFNEYKDVISHFVLLPYMTVGRAKEKTLDFDYLFCILKEMDRTKIAFGANFYEEIKKYPWLDVSLYEPEIMSCYLDFVTMKKYKSSFESEPFGDIEL